MSARKKRQKCVVTELAGLNKASSIRNRVIATWYRSPQLLLGVEEYVPEVDIWSVGFLLVQLFSKWILLP